MQVGVEHETAGKPSWFAICRRSRHEWTVAIALGSTGMTTYVAN